MMNMTSARDGATAAAMTDSAQRIARALARAWDWARLRNRARRSVQHARTLDDRLLEDVGLTRADLRREGYFDFFGR